MYNMHKLYWLCEGILIYEMVHGNTPFWDENNLNIYRRILTGNNTGHDYRTSYHWSRGRQNYFPSI